MPNGARKGLAGTFAALRKSWKISALQTGRLIPSVETFSRSMLTEAEKKGCYPCMMLWRKLLRRKRTR